MQSLNRYIHAAILALALSVTFIGKTSFAGSQIVLTCPRVGMTMNFEKIDFVATRSFGVSYLLATGYNQNNTTGLDLEDVLMSKGNCFINEPVQIVCPLTGMTYQFDRIALMSMKHISGNVLSNAGLIKETRAGVVISNILPVNTSCVGSAGSRKRSKVEQYRGAFQGSRQG